MIVLMTVSKHGKQSKKPRKKIPEQFREYAKLFVSGQRVKFGIARQNGKIFYEWAQIISLEDDLLQIQLSRDILPVDVKLNLGTVLELRTGKEGSGQGCRSIIVSEQPDAVFFVRLFGEIIINELREYFRIDVYLPIKHSIPADQSVESVKTTWLNIIKQRAASLTPLKFLSVKSLEEIAQEGYYVWDDVVPIPANISGGGIRVMLPEKLADDHLVNLEIYLPIAEPVIIDAVGEVVYVNPVEIYRGHETFYITGMKFRFIEERARDRIVNFISAEQLKRIRQMRLVSDVDMAVAEPLTIAQKIRRLSLQILFGILSLLFILYLTDALIAYKHHHEKNEIGRIFEEGVKKYMDKFSK